MRPATATLVVLVGSTQASAPARAKCGYEGSVAERLAAAEIVFQGRQVGLKEIHIDREIVDDFQGRGRESSAWLGEFHVEKVWKGNVGSAIGVVTEPITCGWQFGPVGGSYVLLARRVGPYVVAHACGGIPSGYGRVALDLLGAPKVQYPPDATTDLDAGADVGHEAASAPSLVVAGFFAGAAVATLGFACLGAWVTGWTCRRPRRRRAD
jgi:hypothetical protein